MRSIVLATETMSNLIRDAQVALRPFLAMRAASVDPLVALRRE